MKRACLSLLLAFAGATASAQSQDEQAAERARITAERQRVEAAYGVDQKTCYAKFSVNDCLAAARSRRNAVLSDLRRQEIDLNDAERRRRSSQRQAELEERAAAVPKPDDGGRAAAAQREREVRVTQREAERAAATARPPVPETAVTGVPQAQPGNAAAVQRHAERVAEIEARKARAQQRAAERKKPAASGLPLPR